MGMPDEKTLKEMREKIEAMGDDVGTIGLPENPTTLEKFRWDIHQELLRYKRLNGCTQKEMAKKAGVDESKMSKILRHRLDEFSTDRLITIYSRINPDVTLKVG